MTRLITMMLGLWLTTQATADDYVEWVGANSGVNWSAGQVQAEGAGVAPPDKPQSLARLLACRAAVVDAQRNLLESIEGVRVQGTTVVGNMMVESDVIKTTVEGLLQGGQIVARNHQDDGTCVVQMTAPLGGRFTTDVYGEVFSPATAYVPNQRSAGELLGQLLDGGLTLLIPAAKAGPGPVPWQASIDEINDRLTTLEDLITTIPAIVDKSSSGPTGLVIDARGSNFIPSMSPMIRKLRAGVIYPTETHLSTRRERGQLVSLFTRDLDTAKRHPVVGDRPIVMKALRTFNEARTQIVLGTETADRLADLVKEGLLNDAGVIIVL